MSFQRITLTIIFLLIVNRAISQPVVRAQSESTQLATLAVELWPDYDRPAMLVLLTGTLPESVALPATLSIPVPTDADINAVARFAENGGLLSDVTYSVADGLLTLTTPSSRFRVEYYAPYEVNDGRHEYTFNWTSGLTIDQLATVVQQPLAATGIRISPAPASAAADRGDGLTYHVLPARPVGAGEPFTVEVSYEVESPVLSAPSQPVAVPATGTPVSGTTAGDSGLSPWWLLAIVGLLALLGGAWYLGRQQGRNATRARKPQPARTAKPRPGDAKPGSASSANRVSGSARYCHHCGQAAQPGDAFCRNCGTQLKQ